MEIITPSHEVAILAGEWVDNHLGLEYQINTTPDSFGSIEIQDLDFEQAFDLIRYLKGLKGGKGDKD